MKRALMSLSLAAALAVGAASPAFAQASDQFFNQTMHAAEVVSDQLQRRQVGSKPLLVMAGQNLNDLKASDGVGRLVGELVSSSLAAQGWPVQEVRMREALRVNSEGEHLLSRDLEHLRKAYDADVAVVSTYSENHRQLYITIKAVRIKDGVVIASHSFTTKGPGRQF